MRNKKREKEAEKYARENNRRKKDSKKGIKKKNIDKSKLKREKAFLYFLAYNPHSIQIKKFISSLLIPDQYTVLREIAVNELAGNIPSLDKKKEKVLLKKSAKVRLTKLAKGELRKSNIHHIVAILRLLARHTVDYHDLC